MDPDQLAQTLASLGCPPERCVEMAVQLDRRAGQLAVAKGCSQEEALAHLLALMAGGWAARAAADRQPVEAPRH